MADISQRQFFCPRGRHTGEFEWNRTCLIYAYIQDGKEVWWCEKCKDHFVREGDEFYPLLGG